jgi:hypothetical protein
MQQPIQMAQPPMQQQQQQQQQVQQQQQQVQQVQMARPPSSSSANVATVQMAQPPLASASQYPPSTMSSSSNYPQPAETFQLARPSSNKRNEHVVEQVPNLYPQVVAESRTVSVAPVRSSSTPHSKPSSSSSSSSSTLDRSKAKQNYAPAPSLHHEASAPSLTLDTAFDQIKHREIPQNANYGSLSMTMSVAQQQYGVAPPERRDTPNSIYDTAPPPETLESDDFPTMDLPSAPSHKPEEQQSRSKVRISQQALYS